MNPAKLRRSWDVSEPRRLNFENSFQISSLAVLNVVLRIDSNGEEFSSLTCAGSKAK